MGRHYTHYPCGAFSFSHGAECQGYTAQLVSRGGYLEDRRIFVDLDRESFLEGEGFQHGFALQSGRRRTIESRAPSARFYVQKTAEEYNGRIGVLLQDLGGISAHVRHVLVVESRIPRFFPEPPGTMPALSPHPAPGLSFEDHTHVYPADAGCTVTTMIVTPLESGCTQPPEHVQERLRLFCEERPMERREAERNALQSAMPDIVWHAFKAPQSSNHSENEYYDCFEDEDIVDSLMGDAPNEAWFHEDEDEEEGAVGEQEEQ